MSGRLLDDPAAAPEVHFYDESWLTKREKRASMRYDPQSLPGTPLTNSNSRRRVSHQQQVNSFNVVSKGRSTEEVMAKSSYRRSCRASFFEQCFEVKGDLGRGSFGEVLSVVSRDTGTSYAIKRQLKPYLSDFDRQRALREVRNFALLPEHPNLLHLELAWEERSVLYLQTELCVGNLDEYSRLYEVSELEALFIMKDLLKALESLHHNGLIHYDVKPENILISANGFCKLGDFGLLYDMIKDQSGDYYHEGDSRYLDASVLDRDHPPSPASDIFSLGLTILELTTDLYLPGNGERWEDLRNDVLPQELMSVLSDELQRAIRKMLRRDSSLRPTATDLLAEPLLEQLANEERPPFRLLPRVMTSSISSPPRKKPRRSARLQLKNNEVPPSFRTPPSSNEGSEPNPSRGETPVTFHHRTPSPKPSTPAALFQLTPTRPASTSRIGFKRLDIGSLTTRLLSSC
ncbi:hypothetical protein QR680_008697 [Steinernema hermaphroditum]|uniref:non-specific serine/threonine protein kinase n=1 Tax=Steinernema hermaphroditum TaxID=289476 RepID=A0AA39M7H4_9BILA|nr:hypothetical protein QR680_008697 [Steinernema hermaphroditum]